VLELGNCPGFGDEAIEPPSEAAVVLFGDGRHRMVILAHRQVDRQVLFDRDQLVEIRVFDEIGDTEAALSC